MGFSTRPLDADEAARSRVGLRLFDRLPRGVELTQAGELFLERARVALTAAESAGAIGRGLEAGVVGSVRLGIATGGRWRFTADLLQRFSRERPGVEFTVLEGYGGTLWRDLRDGRLDALVAPAGHASPHLRTLELGFEAWVVLIGTGHPLAGIGPVAAGDLDGERIVVTGHPDGAAFDRTIAELLTDLGVCPGPEARVLGPALHAAVAGSEVVALTTAPGALPAGVVARSLDPQRTLSFELLWRDETPSPALAGLISLATANARRRPSTRPLAAVA